MNRTAADKLAVAAQEAARNAYAPYSKFKVGAAVMTDKGIFSGCNVENSSYGLTTCAERVAVFKAVSEGAKVVKAVAVFATSPQSKIPNPKSKIGLPFPCGACLQVINEFGENPDIILSNGERTEFYRLKDLLPNGFRLKK